MIGDLLHSMTMLDVVLLDELLPQSLFSPGNDTFSPAFQIALVGIQLSVVGQTYGRYLHYERSFPIKVFFIWRVGSRGPGLTCGQKKRSEFFSAICGDISPRFAMIFPSNSEDDFPPQFRELFRGIIPEIFSLII